jgi:hypothetical protein
LPDYFCDRLRIRVINDGKRTDVIGLLGPLQRYARWHGTRAGSVAETWNGLDESAHKLSSSGETEELVDEADFACHSRRRQHVMATTDHPHHLEVLGRRTCRFHALEAAGRPDYTLERSMIRLDDVVKYSDVQCATTPGSSTSICRRRMALGYDTSLSVVIDAGGQSLIVSTALCKER